MTHKLLSRSSKFVAVLGGVALTALAVPFSSVRALELSDGTTAFEHNPLIASSSQRSIGMRERYRFTITVPEDAGESLKTISFRPVAGASEMLFYSNSAVVEVGGEEVAAEIASNETDGLTLLEVALTEAAAPGSLVTVELEGPRITRGGPSMIGVFASADAENPAPYFMGCMWTLPAN
ncbi:DUF2808 domain-containing protein [Synechococcus sp. PCC 7336]|uniref:DUF2808 domain-containing protein n=1 Tax=Synechococcus sp. PCC 7336 TaxID=195250 RepID=UPI00036EAD4A|nr:DUF2808 domain-containing protein [Synechococcus sp. PCC 7336]